MNEVGRLFENLDNLIDDYVDLEDRSKASNKMLEYLKEKEPEHKGFVRAEDLLNELTYENEKQGFIYGFKYAVALLMSGRNVTVKE